MDSTKLFFHMNIQQFLDNIQGIFCILYLFFNALEYHEVVTQMVTFLASLHFASQQGTICKDDSCMQIGA